MAADVYPLTPIGFIHSCFDEKFGTPRQPGLAPAATAELILRPPYDHPDCLRGLEGCSHIWVIFLFHRSLAQGWSPTVRPPRLGGNRRLGVFATRSPFRPNGLGLSVVELDGVIAGPERYGLRLRNHDLVEGTPVLDIKPYIAYSDALQAAQPPTGFGAAPERLPVHFSAAAEAQAAALRPDFRALVIETLGLDPRPAYKRRTPDGEYGVTLEGVNIRWRVDGGAVIVESIG